MTYRRWNLRKLSKYKKDTLAEVSEKTIHTDYISKRRNVQVSTLYELSTNYQNILEIAEMLDEDQLKEALVGLDDEIENKADGYARVIKELESQTEAIKLEAKRLADRKKALENNVKRMKESLQDQMLLMDKRKIKTPLFSFNIQNNPPSLLILDEKQIPKRFYEEQDPKLNKQELLKAMKDGEELNGVEIKQGESLRIR